MKRRSLLIFSTIILLIIIICTTLLSDISNSDNNKSADEEITINTSYHPEEKEQLTVSEYLLNILSVPKPYSTDDSILEKFISNFKHSNFVKACEVDGSKIFLYADEDITFICGSDNNDIPLSYGIPEPDNVKIIVQIAQSPGKVIFIIGGNLDQLEIEYFIVNLISKSTKEYANKDTQVVIPADINDKYFLSVAVIENIVTPIETITVNAYNNLEKSMSLNDNQICKIYSQYSER